MFTLFYFENKFFTKFNLNTKFVGHQIFYKNKTEKKKKLYVFYLDLEMLRSEKIY